MKEVAIIGATIYGNRGAEAMLCSTIGSLRARLPELRFNVYSYYPEDDRALVTTQGIQVHSATPLYLVSMLAPLGMLLGLLQRLGLGLLEVLFPSSVRALARSRVLLDLAGVSFIDGREIFLPYNTLTLWPAMALGVPVVKLAQAIGPVGSRPNRLAARLTLPRCRRIFARGGKTREYLTAFGGLTVEQAGDVAFLYRPEYALSNEAPPAFRALLGELDRHRAAVFGPVVGICPSSVVASRARRTGRDYVGLVTGLAHGLAERGCRIVLFPNATRLRYEAAERNNDIPLIEEIAARLEKAGAPAVLTAGWDINTRSIRELISRLDVVVTSRFHAMVAALAQGVPTGVIGWSHKYTEVMEDFGQERCAWDWQAGSGEQLLESVLHLLENRESVRARIKQALPAVQAAARVQFDRVVELIDDE